MGKVGVIFGHGSRIRSQRRGVHLETGRGLVYGREQAGANAGKDGGSHDRPVRITGDVIESGAATR